MTYVMIHAEVTERVTTTKVMQCVGGLWTFMLTITTSAPLLCEHRTAVKTCSLIRNASRGNRLKHVVIRRFFFHAFRS